MPLIDALRTELRAEIAELRNSNYNTDRMIRALCSQGGIQPNSLGLRTPAVPPVLDAGPGTPSASSIISTSSSSLHIQRMDMPSTSASRPFGAASDLLQIHGKSLHTPEHFRSHF
jgi:hypothetical protein